MVPNIKSSTITIDPKVQVIDNFLDSYRFKQEWEKIIFDERKNDRTFRQRYIFKNWGINWKNTKWVKLK